MNEVMKALLERRSIRKFTKQPIGQEELEQIVKAALYAPSAMARQTWKFTVVTDPEKIQRLASAIREEIGREGYNMYEPQALIIPSNDRDNHLGADDNACALENIFLAAYSFGIGSVWLNQLHGICDVPAVREILNEWEIPQNHVVYGMAALGYPDGPLTREVEKIGKVHYVR